MQNLLWKKRILKFFKWNWEIFCRQISTLEGNWINKVIDFREANSKDIIKQRVDSMRKLNGDTCIGEALDYFYSNMFTAQATVENYHIIFQQ